MHGAQGGWKSISARTHTQTPSPFQLSFGSQNLSCWSDNRLHCLCLLLEEIPRRKHRGPGEGRWGRWGKWEAKGVKGGEERGGKGEGCWMLACSYTAWPASQSRCSDNQNEHNPTMKWLVHDESTRQSRGGGLKGRGSSPSVLFPSLNHSCFAGSPSLKLRCFSFDLLHAVQKTV